MPDAKVIPILDRMGRGIERCIQLHEQTCPARRRKLDPGQADMMAIPHAQMRIPDEELAQMVELLETEEDVSLDSLAERFHRPRSVVFRDLNAYWHRYFQWVMSGRKPRWAC